MDSGAVLILSRLGQWRRTYFFRYEVFLSFTLLSAINYSSRQNLVWSKRYTGCRKINVFQVGGLVGKNLRNLEKIK
jgi:hypothetical protein